MRAGTGLVEPGGRIWRGATVDEAHPPATKDLNALSAAARKCKACPLWKSGTQTVFGEGPNKARVVFVGEQPGDKEDLEGRPFIGPAGRLLDKALEEAGVDRGAAYVTNAVKHFKWEPVGKRRLHKKPNAREIAACRPWLEAELAALEPELIVCLGATAAQSVLQRVVKIGEERGKVIECEAGRVLVTVHPSSLLRAMGQPDRAEVWARFVADLRVVKKVLG